MNATLSVLNSWIPLCPWKRLGNIIEKDSNADVIAY